MKHLYVKIVLISILFSACLACNNSKTEIELTQEMKTIIEDFQNPSISISESLGQFSDSIKVTDHSICYYNLKKPNIISNVDNCYTVRFDSGVTIREYVFVWQNNMIVEIIDNGIVG